MSPNEIHAELIRRGVTQASIARSIGRSPKTVNVVIHGHARSRMIAEHVASILGRPFHAVFPAYARN